jgi:hypothetical protein
MSQRQARPLPLDFERDLAQACPDKTHNETLIERH